MPAGTIHDVSLLLGELKASLSHLNNNVKMRDEAAERQRQELRREIEDMRVELKGVGDTTLSVQQDVAELKNDLSEQETRMMQFEQERPIAIAAIKSVDELKAFMKATQDRELVEQGWWSAVRGIGKLGWTAIAAICVAAFSIFLQYGMPYIVEMLQRP